MNYFFTSDTHFFHANAIQHTSRPYSNVEEMNTALVNNWNKVVGDNDVVYHLGDVSFGKQEPTMQLVSQLKGRKHLVIGNHDRLFKKSPELRCLFVDVKDYAELTIPNIAGNGGKTLIAMSHYPMITWNKSHYGSFMLHGHCHGQMQYPFVKRIKDVGVDCNHYRPVELEQLVTQLNSIEYTS